MDKFYIDKIIEPVPCLDIPRELHIFPYGSLVNDKKLMYLSGRIISEWSVLEYCLSSYLAIIMGSKATFGPIIFSEIKNSSTKLNIVKRAIRAEIHNQDDQDAAMAVLSFIISLAKYRNKIAHNVWTETNIKGLFFLIPASSLSNELSTLHKHEIDPSHKPLSPQERIELPMVGGYAYTYKVLSKIHSDINSAVFYVKHLIRFLTDRELRSLRLEWLTKQDHLHDRIVNMQKSRKDKTA